ncbi:O-Glycosyl hydrolase family 17 protein [Forsythia ovata]|uniref:O-Glycosyl hydrolase family 17 protein n=1 Tax=Forsythia ovata TaxID=205694 RepID=A0ABD1XCU3_9LAMI
MNRLNIYAFRAAYDLATKKFKKEENKKHGSSVAASVGVCYGRVASNLPPPSEVVNLIKSNGISRIRLFNADPNGLKPFSGTGIELMIGVPNEILPTLANGTVSTSLEWLQTNILSNVLPTQIRYLAVGNEVLLKDPFYSPYLVPAILNLYEALQTLGLSETIKLSSSHAASILSSSYPPSSGAFDPNVKPVLLPLLQFLQTSGSPLMVNVYPFFSYINNPQYISLDYALFKSSTADIDQNLAYTNTFDATVDAFVYAMEKEGFPGIPVVVTETGWPAAGGNAASAENALDYNGNIVKRTLNNVGTPKRPGTGVEVFLFDLFNENGKNGEEYERQFGIFGVDRTKVYDLKFN